MKRIIFSAIVVLALQSCQKDELGNFQNDPQVFEFKEVGSITLGGLGAAEI
jgi:hypothetical protein